MLPHKKFNPTLAMCHGQAIAFVRRPTDPETAARRYSNDGLVDPGYTGAIA
jgi:hypothetical protein